MKKSCNFIHIKLLNNITILLVKELEMNEITFKKSSFFNFEESTNNNSNKKRPTRACNLYNKIIIFNFNKFN